MPAERVADPDRSFNIDFAQRIEPGGSRQALFRGIDREGRAVHDYRRHAGAGDGDTVPNADFEIRNIAGVNREPHPSVSRQPRDLDDAPDAANDSREH